MSRLNPGLNEGAQRRCLTEELSCPRSPWADGWRDAGASQGQDGCLQELCGAR